MNTDNHVRVILWMPRDLYGALKSAAQSAGEPVPDALRARLSASLAVDAARQRAKVMEAAR